MHGWRCGWWAALAWSWCAAVLGAQDVDLRPQFAAMGLEARAQGARPTCSVFAVTGALEFALGKCERPAPRLSVEFLDWAANACNGVAMDGGFFSELWQGFATFGICDERELPYRGAFDAGMQPDDKALAHAAARRGRGLQLHWIKPWDVTTGLGDEHVAAIRAVLQSGWPVCAGMRWPKAEHWTDGMLDWAEADGVRDGHSVLLVGCRDDAALPGGGAFLIRNSGGGLRDGLLSYRYARAYVNDAAWIGAPLRQGDLDLSLLNPMGAPVVGRNRRVSSNEQPWHDANLDMDWLMPGQSVEVPLLQGPGVITHMWFTSHAGWVGELNALVLRIYYDGHQEPGVEVPLGDFFATGQGRPAVVESVPVQVSPTGALTCYWRMPFQQSARITVTNDNPDRSTGLYWQIDWVQVDALSPTTPSFYAKFRREYPARPGDYVVADLQGKGCFVGAVMSFTLGQDGWFGEGDDFFYVDGEAEPSLQGTGSEDYFNDAWGFRVRTGPWFGQPRWQGDEAGDSGVAYRWHLPDPVCFAQSLRFCIEHKGNWPVDTDGFFVERPDFVSSVAMWYQLGQPKPFGQLPPWHERRVPWQGHLLVKAFQKAKVTGLVPVRVETQGFFGARPVLAWANDEPGALLTLPFEVAVGGRFAVRLTTASGRGQGAYDVEIDGAKVCSKDLRGSDDAEVDLALGTRELAAGAHTLAFRATADAGAVGALTVEELRLLPLPPPAQRTEFTHHEAHFIRLGIGRAVYAWRLAFDALPESLQAMVDAGFMPARFLRDENGLPLKVWRDGDRLLVQSPGKDHWQHGWQGLDPRR